MIRLPVSAALLAIAVASPAHAAVSLGVALNISGDAQLKTANYLCEGRDDPLVVEYVNAAPNFLALIPVDGEDMVFVNVISGSGAKYEAGQFVWWNKGTDATLHDVTEGLDAAPVLTCSENIQTP